MSEESIIKSFESIGIPKMQTIVYLDLLKNKESSPTQISKRTKLHRSNVYDILIKLKEKNLVHLFVKEGKQTFAALPADSIMYKEKEKMENLKSAMEYIKTTYIHGQTPKVYTLEGLNPVKNILFSLLEKKKEIWVYGLAENENLINVINNKLMHSFHLERIKKGINLKLLFYKLPEEDINELIGIKFTEARLLPQMQQARVPQITQIVCDGSVYITLWVSPVYTIVIENEIIAKEYLDFYSLLWESSKKIN